MRRMKVLAAIAWCILTAGCPNGYTPEKKPAPEKPEFVWSEELFTAEPEEGGRTRTVFSTNDKKYWTYEGLTVWTVMGEAEEEFSRRTVTMAKSSGYSGGGYGIVFCHGEYEVKGKNVSAMYVVMISNEGKYIIGKAIGGIFTDYGWWKPTPYLNRGAGASNELTVRYEKEKDSYSVEINGKEIEEFSNDGEPALRGGKNGYIAVITPFDRFPVTGIDVYYLEGRSALPDEY